MLAGPASPVGWPAFAAIAVDQGAQAVRPTGLVVNYNPDGSAAGRADYIANQDDFAASDVPFRTSMDKLAGLGPEHVPQGFSYLPAPASAVALFYHLTVGGHPVTELKLGNAAGDFVRPGAENVTASLSRATVIQNPRSPHFMQVDPAHLYTSTAPTDYPLSFTSYLIVPRIGTRLPTHFTKAKGRTLSTFLIYALCAGEKQIAHLGYAPLPENLVKADLLQVANIPGHVPAQCPATLRS